MPPKKRTRPKAALIAKPSLPENIVTDILSRLPVKSLMRFRSVCKSWCSLFRNQDFIAKQHHFQTLNSNTTVIVKHALYAHVEECFSIVSSAIREDGSGDEVVTAKNIVWTSMMITGSVNGLVCVSDKMYGLHALWNPATREFKFECCFFTTKALPGSRCRWPSNVGFGFDKNTNDFKIIRFLYNHFEDGYIQPTGREQVELYSLKNDSWRELPSIDVTTYEMKEYVTPHITPYINGVCYWWAKRAGTVSRSSILCFDFASEMFEELPLPDLDASVFEFASELWVFKGMLSVVTYTKVGEEDTLIDIWAMTDRGVNESWKKLVTTGPIQGFKRLIGFWKNKMFMENIVQELVLYDLSTQVSNLTLDGRTDSLQVADYVECLVPLNVKGEEEEKPFIRL